ncbi:ADP-forming succinate--CoA ligase subunit beta [Truepera radiovictrix]|uniref:Succinate--CoA ligase [ADP-forming] subunit beta n=1 Tax=Truepera radiovictrix (strain DSM 17093 / CIP 108686 / LMG 22925 / RQ-24) TaxID=649638 RepID=D7CWI3_TRURR|nr:ADP-forming succinate--CoA ligase subunit beta [Truepera radiovictrix]ADI14382.1 succinyl-CoA synthetase, beta subunit [Truepera radiovictrix DSM 17093]WMT57061.1 ADP-forming succinate--CoA ligase subunit beta [Truepera radiovictrix]
MNIHEYQAKELMQARGVAVPQGAVARTVEEAVAAVRPLVEATGNPVVVLKSQIHAGGRGKGRFKEHPEVAGVNVITDGLKGGVRATEERVRELAKAMLGSTLVTVQTGESGKQVNRLYIEQGIDIGRELYLSVVLDRAVGRNVMMASTEGGVEIEEVAERSPEKILREHIDPLVGLANFQAARLAHGLGLTGDALKNGVRFMRALAKAAEELDTDMIEINPLVVTKQGQVMALDGKMSFDNNALFRHKMVAEMRDTSEEDPAELEASNYGLSFIKLDGTIGCLVNGAGLAMATMDIIKHVGGEPANFLDVGGGATTENVTAAFKIITKDPNVRGIFVNIFGGIMKCDTIANGVVEAVRQVGLEVPLVVRLEGTNVDLGKRIIDESGLNVVSAKDMKDGAQKIVELAK